VQPEEKTHSFSVNFDNLDHDRGWIWSQKHPNLDLGWVKLVRLTISLFEQRSQNLFFCIWNSVVKFSCHLIIKSLKNISKDLDSDFWEAILGLVTKQAVP